MQIIPSAIADIRIVSRIVAHGSLNVGETCTEWRAPLPRVETETSLAVILVRVLPRLVGGMPVLALRTPACTPAYQDAISVPRNGSMAIGRNKRNMDGVAGCAGSRSEASLLCGIFFRFATHETYVAVTFPQSGLVECIDSIPPEPFSGEVEHKECLGKRGSPRVGSPGPSQSAPYWMKLVGTGALAWRIETMAPYLHAYHCPPGFRVYGRRNVKCRCKLLRPSASGGGERSKYKQDTALAEVKCPIYGSGRRLKRP